MKIVVLNFYPSLKALGGNILQFVDYLDAFVFFLLYCSFWPLDLVT